MKFLACCVLPDKIFSGNCFYWCKYVRDFDDATQCFQSDGSRSYDLTPQTCLCYRCCALEQGTRRAFKGDKQSARPCCTLVKLLLIKKAIILTPCTSTQRKRTKTRKRTKKELPNSYIKLFNYRHPIVRFLQKTRAWSRSKVFITITTLVQITNYTSPNYTDRPQVNIHCIEIFSQFTIFEQLVLALKTELPWKNSLYWIHTFYIPEFWATCACPEKQRVPWINSTEYIFRLFEQNLYYLRFLSNLRLPWKRELPWNFSLYLNIFYHLGFLSNSRFLWKTELPWKFSLHGMYFSRSKFLSNLHLFWKTEFALEFFTVLKM